MARFYCLHIIYVYFSLKRVINWRRFSFSLSSCIQPSPFMSRMKLWTSKQATPKLVFLKVIWLCDIIVPEELLAVVSYKWQQIEKNIMMKIQQTFCWLAIQCSRTWSYINKLLPTIPPPYLNGSIFRGLWWQMFLGIFFPAFSNRRYVPRQLSTWAQTIS